MGVEVKPLGVKCNIQCQYCYQNPIRDAGNVPHRYDLERIRAAIEEEGNPFGLFGGEALLMPHEDLESLWAWGLTRFGQNAVQTNGTLVDDEHIRMFKQYRVRVGVSLDGPGALNDARWHGSLESTRRATSKAQAAVERLCREGMAPSVIITLSRTNGAPDRLPALYEWVQHLDAIGVTAVRLHLLESETREVRASYGLDPAENLRALLGFAALEPRLRRLRFDVFRDMRNMLRAHDRHATCIWTGCDPYTTRAVSGIEGNGQRTNCGRTNKDGIDYVKSDTAGFERYLALYLTPQAAGGCQDCRFFLMCKGQCPGTAIDGDWRNRSEHCEVWKALFTHFEQEMVDAGVEPLSQSDRRVDVERAFLAAAARGRMSTLAELVRAAGPV